MHLSTGRAQAPRIASRTEAADMDPQEILDRLLKQQCSQALLPALMSEKKAREEFGRAGHRMPVKGNLTERAVVCTVPKRDIYGSEKTTDLRHFECSMCNRKVAGTRFAAHVSRCYNKGGRR